MAAVEKSRQSSLDRVPETPLGTCLDGPAETPTSGVAKTKYNFMQKKCPGDHALEVYKSPYDGYSCSHCEQDFLRGTILRGCRICDYDTCVECDNRIKQRESQIFAMLDVNSDGTLSKFEIIEAAAKINMTEAEAAALFDQLDINGDGRLTWEEFHNSHIDVAWHFRDMIPATMRKLISGCGCMSRRRKETPVKKISSDEEADADTEEKFSE
mmetsp:Transcript_58847/g.118179  ORF Transcript_58847/g.118179 Transcript_58847/m.118179 type:complete len:212 (+) Transcript_58847:228-863(+)